ncbi:MAG: hypothetical protein ACOYNL_10870 [Rickettsiales bacterium]
MHRKEYRHILTVLLCAALTACGTIGQSKSNISNMYDLPSTYQDNDAYYRQPTTYKGCAVINDAPSCGGG